MLREYYLTRALESSRACSEVVKDMTGAELVRAIQLEEGTLKRQSILKKLYRQSRVLARITHQANLKEQIHGS